MKASLAHLPVAVPLASALLLAAASYLPQHNALSLMCVAALLAAVVAAVHHAEVVAHRVGEPFGTLVLALSVTVIEVALVVSMVLAGGPEKATLARDSVYAAVMIICTGVVAGAWARPKGRRVAGARPCGQHYHARDRPHSPDAGGGTPRDLRGVPVPDTRTLNRNNQDAGWGRAS